MIRTIQCPLPYDQDLVETVRIYNQACQHVIDVGYDAKIFNKKILNAMTYASVRDRFPKLQSSLVQCARDMASAMLKRDKFRCKKPTKKDLSAIRYNQRTFTPFLESQRISISTTNGRKKYDLTIPAYFQQYMHGKATSLTLKIKNKTQIIAYITIELPDIEIKQPKSFLGVDRGIKRVVVLSNNLFWNTREILRIKYKNQHLRQVLQSKGTRSAKRKLKTLSGRERRFMADTNRRIAKWIVNQPHDCIVLERLKGIKTNSKKHQKVNKKVRRKFGNWAYYQLEQFLIQSVEVIGKTILFVNPKYTSQRCHQCGHISKSNRKIQTIFKCQECGYELNADLNSARNISDLGTAVVGRVDVKHPNVATSDSAIQDVLVRGVPVTSPPL